MTINKTGECWALQCCLSVKLENRTRLIMLLQQNIGNYDSTKYHADTIHQSDEDIHITINLIQNAYIYGHCPLIQ